MPSPTVSVIIPTYRHKDYVLETLNSVFAQTYKDYEVIVVNDGSPDDTDQVLRPLREAGQIRYVEQANGGQASARNRGLAEASGELIAFLDDDDLWPPDKLEWQTATLRHRADLVAIAGIAALFEQATASARPRKTPPLVLTCKSLFLRNPLSSPGQMLIRASTMKKLGGFNPNVWGADDLDLWMRLAHFGRIEIEARVALYYRLHATNASHDHLRMLANCDGVFQQNFPLLGAAGGARFQRLAYLRLYRTLGSQMVGEAKRRARNGEAVKALKQLAHLRLFFQRLGFSASLLGAIVRDILPWTLTHRRKTEGVMRPATAGAR